MNKTDFDSIHPKVALKLIEKIVEWSERYQPTRGSMDTISFKHYEIIFVTNRRGEKFRVEAEIDVRWDETTCYGQVGSREVYCDDDRIKCIELSVIDPEK